MISAAFREGCDDATAEIRRDAWTRQTAREYLASVTRDTRQTEMGEYSRGFDATIEAFADNTLDLGVVAVSTRAGAR